MTVVAPEFLDAVRRSELLSEERLAQALETFSPPEDDVEASLARHLISNGLLTHYQAKELLLGRFRRLRIQQYVLRDVLGVGGMGAVYRAVDQQSGRVVALKLLSERLKHDSGMRARFQLEARAGILLSHPRIVKTYHLGVTDDVFGQVDFATMELFEGIALHELVGMLKSGLPIHVACDITCQVAEALEYIHQRGMVHRDVKPDNVLIDTAGNVKIIDFGLTLLNEAARDDEFSLAMIFGHDCLGTADYMPPEQSVDSLHVDARADIYSLGCTLFVALTAQRPFAAKSPKEVIAAHQQSPIPDIREINPDVPVPVAEAITRMLAKSPEDRFAGMADVIAALQPFARRKRIEFDYNDITRRRMALAIRQGRMSMRPTSTAMRLTSGTRRSSAAALQTTDPPTDTAITRRGSGIRDGSESAVRVPKVRSELSAAGEAEQLLAGLSDDDDAARTTRASVQLPDGSLYLLTRANVVVGRDPESDLRLDHRRLSGRHCRLSFDGNSWRITDLGSKNGIKVNGRPVTGTALFAGDRVTLADEVHLRLQWPDGPRRPVNLLPWVWITLFAAAAIGGLAWAWWNL